MKNILFRTDSSSTVGTGHIMRDLVLASKYKNYNIIFASRNLDDNINNKIIDAGYKLKVLKSNDIKEVKKLIKKYKISLLVIDHYGIDWKYEKELKSKYPKLQILSFDDTYEKHHCDILLNHNISANKKRYKNLVPKNCILHCGSQYTLLRDEFIKEKNKTYKKDKSLNKIFIAMGGADVSNINIDILKVLKKFQNIHINLITTKANKNLEQLKKYCKNKLWIRLHINSNKVAQLMRKSDFAIVTPSVTLNEVYFMKLPFLAIKTASNQQDIYSFLEDRDLPTLKKFNSKKLYNKIIMILNEI